MKLASYTRLKLASLLGMVVGTSLFGADPVPSSIDFFESRIRPVLVKHCYECHSLDAEKIGGSLMLDSPDAMRSGGDSGPAISPGDVAGSLLISALKYEGAEMPPDGKLSNQVLADFEAWIAAGAVDPRRGTPQPIKRSALPSESQMDLQQGRQFWAFQPIKRTFVPAQVGVTSKGLVDTFLEDRLQQAKIFPNETASPQTRIRRLVFDLTGLPPNIDLQNRWLADPTEKQWQRIVDELLASPQFGEHWGRHWLDVARYADSNGSDFNATYHDAWRYRDYVIDSFNQDRPFDEFVRQQIAGDLLPTDDEQSRTDGIVATTFLMLGTKMLSERDKLKMQMDIVDDQIDTVGRVFMGLTLGCARCHDHKFDPIPTEDYYALAGIFRSSESFRGESQKYVSTWQRTELPAPDELVAAHASHNARIKSIKSEIQDVEAKLKTAQVKAERQATETATNDSQTDSAQQTEGKSATAAAQPSFIEELMKKANELAEQLKAAQNESPTPLPTAMAIRESVTDQISDCAICIRGEPRNLGPVVPRGFLQVCDLGTAKPIGHEGSGRRELADWLADPNHPLVARVIVNRVWMYLMGNGLVRTVDNFGTRGELPSHPELLDRLASDFVRDGWQVKHLIRGIVLSAAYQRSSDFSSVAAARDPENRLWWRMPRRRLPAESVRDTMLVVAGEIDERPVSEPMKSYGVLVSKNSGDESTSVAAGTQVRSIYQPVIRGYQPPLLAMLDAADPDLIVGQRPTTNVPSQTFVLINSPEVHRWAELASARAMRQASTFTGRVDWLIRTAWQRFPADQDFELARRFGLENSSDQALWRDYIVGLFAATEFRLLD